jgi:hypothetical protein
MAISFLSFQYQKTSSAAVSLLSDDCMDIANLASDGE